MMESGKKNATPCFPIFSRAEYAMIAPGSYTLLTSCFLLAPRDHRLTVVIWFPAVKAPDIGERVGTAWGPHREGPQPEQAAERRSIYHQVSASLI